MDAKETEIVTCPNCGGTGKAWDYIFALHESVLDKCATCNGHGRIESPIKGDEPKETQS